MQYGNIAVTLNCCIMKDLFLIYRVDYIIDQINGDGIQPLWCCDSEEKAKSDILKLKIDFDIQKEKLGLSYSMLYFYKSIRVY